MAESKTASPPRGIIKYVVVAEEVIQACWIQALSTDQEEVMGLLIGARDDATSTIYVLGVLSPPRAERSKDRVEADPEALAALIPKVEQYKKQMGLSDKDNECVCVGWFHSHPRITVEPSHVDLRTQFNWQQMGDSWVGLIFSCFRKKAIRRVTGAGAGAGGGGGGGSGGGSSSSSSGGNGGGGNGEEELIGHASMAAGDSKGAAGVSSAGGVHEIIAFQTLDSVNESHYVWMTERAKLLHRESGRRFARHEVPLSITPLANMCKDGTPLASDGAHLILQQLAMLQQTLFTEETRMWISETETLCRSAHFPAWRGPSANSRCEMDLVDDEPALESAGKVPAVSSEASPLLQLHNGAVYLQRLAKQMDCTNQPLLSLFQHMHQERMILCEQLRLQNEQLRSEIAAGSTED